MIKEAMIAKVTRVTCREVNWGKRGLVTSVAVDFGDEEDNEDRHVPSVELTVEYAGHPRHKVGDTFPALADAALLAMGVV